MTEVASGIPPLPLGGDGGDNTNNVSQEHQQHNNNFNNNQPNTVATTAINSTPYLQSRLSQLKTQSQHLSTELTKKLASSRSGQSLLNIGPSLSTLPPDLTSLIDALSPLLSEVSNYESLNIDELTKLVNQGKVVQCTIQKQEYAMKCSEIYNELVSAEEILKMDAGRRMTDMLGSSSGKGGDKKKKGEEMDDVDLSDSDEEDDDEELDHASSLERAAYTTLHLLQELQSSTEQVSAITMNTPAKNKAPDSGNNSSNILPSLNDTSSSGINGVIMEKSRFLMKLAPRIRRLESDTAKCLVGRLESLLVKVRTLMEEQQQLTNGNDLSSVGGDTIMSQNQHVQSEYKQKHSELLLTISHTLRGLAILNKGNEAQSTFARIAIMPIIKSKLSMGKLHEGGPRGECSGLFFLLDDIVTVVRSMYGDILRISEGMFTNNVDNDVSNKGGVVPMEIDLVTCGVWVPVATALTADPGIKMAIFSPGIANVLQANYSALDTFLSELAGSLLTPPAHEEEEDSETKTNDDVELGDFSHLYYQPRLTTQSIENAQKRLYGHPTTVDYYKRWNLPIYYQLRFAEFTKRLDKALQRIQSEGWHADVYSGDESDAKKIRDELGLELPIFIELYDVILSLWKSTVFLRPLTHRFLRGAVQLVGRILAFVRAGLEGEIEFGGSSGDSSAAESKRKGDDEEETGGAPSASETVVGMPSYFWNERVEDIAVVAWELTILDTTMSHDYLEAVTNTVCPSDKESQESTHNSSSELDEIKLLASEILTESSRSISPIVSYSWNTLIVDNLTSQCCTPLSAVKGVAATYRMTNRPPPTQASPFVATILRPLQEFDKTFSSRTPPQIGDDWKRTVIATVSDKYSVAVEELIATVKRTEEALKSRKTRRMMAGGMSDGEKVKLQLFLDHKAFKTQVEELLGGGSVENEGITGLDKLGELTHEAETLFEQTQSK